ncbi:MAG TPA: hypothetical protein VG406_00060 [Isosphaeraceae bacterium]|jgi:hypothetical protein|nr:hypothetical protein [Isosphaeraceae bacterium]
MPERGGKRTWVVGALTVAAIGGAMAYYKGRPGPFASSSKAKAEAPSPYNGSTPMATLVAAIKAGDARALAEVFERTTGPDAPAPGAVDEAEAPEAIALLGALRDGRPRFGDVGQATAMAVAGRVFDRLAIDPAPAAWSEALPPTQDLLMAGLGHRDGVVRAATLEVVGRLWNWIPGRTMFRVEERAVGVWKESLYQPVLRALAAPDPTTRAAAVACLAALPIDDAAAPAVAYVADKTSAEVRKRALLGFARRASILPDDMILPRLHDADKLVALVAETVLKGRGLTPDQIALGRLVFHPDALERGSVIPKLAGRTDIDPVLWLLHLSRDPVADVRARAASALAHQDAPEARARLEALAASDRSPLVQDVARRLLRDADATVSLPPLPGSANLNPRAN